MSDLIQLQPFDEHNRTLRDHVRPPKWINPTPSGRYNLIVIGAGTAGLVAAAGAAGLGAKVALIERELMGGDCLNVGCVPSKALISSARIAAAVRSADEFGIHVNDNYTVDFVKVMERMRRLRAKISPHDSAQRFADLGVDVYLGEGQFIGRNVIEVAGQPITFKKAVIATGARAAAPSIPGLHDAGFLTNESVFSLTTQPRHLAVVGGGPIGSELAQVFARFGSQVTLIEKADHILNREDPDAARIVQEAMRRDGVKHLLNSKLVRVEVGDDDKTLQLLVDGREQSVRADEILLGMGRAPNVEQLQLDLAGVEFDTRNGVHVNDRLQTTNPNIYAAGDVCSPFKFTHAADFMARLVIRNALFLGRSKMSSLTIPWCTYTSPELAHVGLSAQDAQRQGMQISTYTIGLGEIDRAVLDGETDGFVRAHVRQGTDRIVGATIVAGNAGDMIGQFSLAMTQGIGLGKIANSIQPYPTQADAIRRLGDIYQRSRLTPPIQKLFRQWLAWTR